MEFDVQITTALLRKVALRRILRSWPWSLASVVLIGSAVCLDSQGGPFGTASIIGLTAVGMQWIFYVAHYIRQTRTIADWKRLQGDAPVHYMLDEEKLRATSNLGATELRWNVFRELVEYADCFLLGTGRGSHLTLPRASLPSEVEDFLRQKFRSLNLPVNRA